MNGENRNGIPHPRTNRQNATSVQGNGRGSDHHSRPGSIGGKTDPSKQGRPMNHGARPQGQRPEKAPIPNAMKRPHPENPKKKAPQPKPELSRNIILAGILLLLVVILLIVSGVRSCTTSERNKTPAGENNIIMNTEPVETFDDAIPTYSEYTDESESLNISSGYGILIDLDKNKVIASKGAEQRIYPASMTKILTLIIACEKLPDKSATYTFDDLEMLDRLYLDGASVAGFKMNETVTVEDLIYGTILPSGGDATNALADLIGGSEEGFAEIMNEKIRELGLKNTHFVTSSGLHDPNHYTTCHDMAIILEYAISNPYMRKVLGTYQYTTSKTEQHPEGILLTSTMYSRMKGDEVEGLYIQGGKTGYTNEALNCLASFAASCREDESLSTMPQYLLVTAYGAGEYAPIYDAIDVYKKYCSE